MMVKINVSKKYLKNLFRERFNEIIELTHESSFDDSNSKRFGDCKSGMKIFKNIKYEATTSEKISFFLYSSLNNIKRERHKSEEQKSALQNTEMLYKARKKSSNYLMIII